LVLALLRTQEDQLQQVTKIDNKICTFTSGKKSWKIQELEWEPYASFGRQWNRATMILVAS
jgi:hypothetical protein